MESLKTIIVTGCNKGVGYGIIENLYQKPYKIIMACRNLKLAIESKDKLEKQFPQAKGELHPLELDITQEESMDKFIKEFSEKYSKTDILLNNAGVAISGDGFDEKIAAYTLGTNFFATLAFTEKMTPLITKNGKIIIVGSSAGKLTRITKESLRHELLTQDLTIEKLKKFGNEFVEAAKSMDYEKHGWPRNCYSASKILINVFARIYSKQQKIVENGIQVYALCPGWVKTDMTGDKAALTIQQGVILILYIIMKQAETPVFLVELPFEINPDYQGNFFYEKKVTSLI